MPYRTISSLLTGYMQHISSHVRNIHVTRYKNVIIYDIPLYTEAKELGEIINVEKGDYGLKIAYSVKEDAKSESIQEARRKV
jgi:hypothetical protein